MACYLCSHPHSQVLHPRTRDRDDVKVLRCGACGLVFLDRVDQVRGAFYEDSGMYGGAPPDPSAKADAEREDTRRRIAEIGPYTHGKRLLDFGCGTGAVLTGLRGTASAVTGVEPNQVMRQHLVDTHGIETFGSLDAIRGTFDMITLFHVLEHMEDPRGTLSRLAAHLAPGGLIHVEVPSADDALITRLDCAEFRAFTYWSCHLYLFSPDTLRRLVDQAGLRVERLDQVQRYPLANHLHWLSRGKPGGHEIWSDLRDPQLDQAYAGALARLGLCDTLVARVRLPSAAPQ